MAHEAMTGANTSMIDKRLQVMLQQAVEYLKRNEAASAEMLLTQILADHPSDADALQLLGTLRKAQLRNAEAEQLYRQSITVKPGQPHVHHNLGNLYKSMRLLDDSIVEQREAVRLKPNYTEAHLALGLALSEKNELTAAEKSIRDALRIQPNYVPAKQSLAVVLNEQGRPKEAEAVLVQTLSTGLRDQRQIAALEHNLGISMQLQQRHVEALGLFDSAQAKVPDMPLVDYNRGNALQNLGRSEAAVESYRRAIARDPMDLVAHRDLNQLLYRLADDDSFLKSYDGAISLFPGQGLLHLNKAHFLFMRERYDDAREAFERAATLLPDNVMPRDALGMIHARQNNFEAAIREHEIALKMEPENAHAWRNFAETLMRAGDPQKALGAAEQSLAIEPDNQAALALFGTALDLLDDTRGQILNDYENFVKVFEIAPPRGYRDMESFNRDLNTYLDSLHKDKRENLDQTLRGGTQTLGNLFSRGHDLVDRLQISIDEAISDYIAGLKDDENHAFLKRRKPDFDYSASWSSRLHDCGFHSNHIHPKGWISSAYYVDVPDAAADKQTKQGWIKFGEPAFEAPLKQSIRRSIQPQTGRLVLFPSYMWHGTVPFQSGTARTTIAFDVVPK